MLHEERSKLFKNKRLNNMFIVKKSARFSHFENQENESKLANSNIDGNSELDKSLFVKSHPKRRSWTKKTIMSKCKRNIWTSPVLNADIFDNDTKNALYS